jgi:transposase
MDRIEQRVVVKYFFLKGHGRKRTQKEFVNTLQYHAVSLCAVKNWLRRFNSGALSCGDEERPGRSLILWARLFSAFRVTPAHFSVDRATIKSIPDRELGLRKFTRIWMPLSYQPKGD